MSLNESLHCILDRFRWNLRGMLIFAAILGAGSLSAAPMGTVSLDSGEPYSVAGDVAIVDVTIVDVATGELAPGMTIVISGERIAAVGPSDTVIIPPDATRIPGEGRFVIPGLWDMHVHMSGPDPMPREIDFPLYIANGVTGIRLMSGDCLTECDVERTSQGASALETVREWRADIEAGVQDGPRIVASSLIFDGPAPMWATSYALDDPAEGRAMVHDAVARGADFLKIMAPPKEIYYAVLDEARKVGIDVAGHVTVDVTMAEASAAGQRSVEHFDWTEIMACSSTPEAVQAARTRSRSENSVEASRAYRRILIESFDEAACAPFFDLLKDNGTWHVPTLSYYRTAARLGEVASANVERLPFLPRSGLLESWWARQLGFMNPDNDRAATAFDIRLDYVGAAHRAGAPLLAGTDAWNPGVFAGFTLHDELELFVEAGMSPLAALRTATVAPAAFFGRQHELGAVRAGYLADLVVLDANPVGDIDNTRRIAAVVANGNVFTQDQLSELLTGARAATGATPEMALEPPKARDVLVWVDRKGNVEPLPGEPRDYMIPRLSPDERRIAVQVNEGGESHIWLMDVATGDLQRFTWEGQRNFNAVWSADGRWIYFSSTRGGDPDLWRKLTDRDADAELVYRAPGPQVMGSVSGDGAWLAFAGVTDGAESRGIGLLSLADAAPPRMLVETSDADEWWPGLSPDGRFVAYESDETGSFEIHVLEVATGKRWIISTGESAWGAGFHHWTHGGSEIVYFSSGHPYTVFAVDVTLEPEPSFSAPRELFELPSGNKLVHDVTSGGERLLMVQHGSRPRRE